MKLTKEILKDKNACSSGYKWYLENGKDTVEQTVVALIASNKLEWANWLVSKMLSNENKIRYAIFAAEQVLNIYENKYPENKAPRKAIEAAKEYLRFPSEENKNAAYAAAYAADAAAYAAAYAADAAAYAAAYAARAATHAAADAAYAAADAARAATHAAADAAYAAAGSDYEMKIKIIRYGTSLLIKE